MRTLLSTVFLIISMFLFQNCTGTEVVNPTLTELGLNFAPYDVNSKLVPQGRISTLSVNSLSICIRYIRFRSIAGDDEDVELNIGELSLSPSGTPIGDFDIPSGNYIRVEIELKSEFCASGRSLQVSNDNGNFSTDEDIKMAFDGSVTVENNYLDMDLYIQTIVSALQNVASDGQVRNAVESVTGSF